jgi:hypothetical protein
MSVDCAGHHWCDPPFWPNGPDHAYECSECGRSHTSRLLTTPTGAQVWGWTSPATAGGDVDTCDRCPAPARYRYERGEARLTLCGHHGQEHAARLRLGGWFTYRIGELTKA